MVAERLRRQGLIRPAHRTPEGVVAWFGAMQAQEYEPATWGIGLRMQGDPGCADVERAVDDGRVVRTHVMRPTWHFVSRADIRWLLQLTAPRVHQAMSSYRRKLELDARVLARCCSLFERALDGRCFLLRAELAERLARAKMPMTGVRLAMAVMYAELEGIICSGPRRGRKFTYANLAERAPKAELLDRDQALAELMTRYLQSHGPATVRDFSWWSGLTIADAKRAMDIVRARRRDEDGLAYWSLDDRPRRLARPSAALLLPIYDEYLVAYRDRVVVPHSQARITKVPGWNVTFQHAVVINGQVAGTWRIPRVADSIAMDVTLVRGLSGRAKQSVMAAAKRYGRFRRMPVIIELRDRTHPVRGKG
jgi:hypothetical protein